MVAKGARKVDEKARKIVHVLRSEYHRGRVDELMKGVVALIDLPQTIIAPIKIQ